MSENWMLQDAKAQLSQLVKDAQKHPQFITVRGIPSVVVISQREYQKLTKPNLSFVEFFQRSPLVGLKLDFARDQSHNRDVDL